MASIVKRKSKYSVVYDYTDENGKRRQRWETFSTNAEAKKRKKQIEYEQDSGTFFIPTAKTLNDLLDEYMSIYGVNTWARKAENPDKSKVFGVFAGVPGGIRTHGLSLRSRPDTTSGSGI